MDTELNSVQVFRLLQQAASSINAAGVKLYKGEMEKTEAAAIGKQAAETLLAGLQGKQ